MENKSNFTVTADQLKAVGRADAVETIERKQKDAADAAFYREFIVEANNSGWYDEVKDKANCQMAEDLALYESYATREEYEKLKIELGLGETATADVVELVKSPAVEEPIAPVVPIDSARSAASRRGNRGIIKAVATVTTAVAAVALASCSTSSPAPVPTPTVASSSANPSPTPSPSDTLTVSPTPNPTTQESSAASTGPTSEASPSTSPSTPETEEPNQQDQEQTQEADIEARDKADAEFFGVSLEQLREFRKDHGFKKDTKFFTNEATELMRDGKGNNGMESDLAIGEKICVTAGVTADECAAELKMAAGANRFLTPYLMSEINGKGGFQSAYENELENKYREDSEAWRAAVEKFLKESKDYTWKLQEIDASNVRWTHSMSKRNPGTIAVLRYAQNGTRLVAYDKNGKEVLGVRCECEQGTEAGHKPVVHKPNKPNKPNKPGKPTPEKPPKELEKKDQSENIIKENDSGSHDSSTDNATVSNEEATTPGGDNSGNSDAGKDKGNEKQSEDPSKGEDFDWNS